MRFINLQISIFLFLISSTLSAQTAPKIVPNANYQLALEASKGTLQTQALKLLIYASVISARGGEIVMVPDNIQARFNIARTAIIAPLPTAVVGVGTYFASRGSAEVFESIYKPITELVKALGRSSYQILEPSLESSANLMEPLWKLVRASWDVSAPLFAVFSNAGSAYLSGAVSGSALLGASAYFSINSTVESALAGNLVPARALLGYNSEVKKKIDEVTKNAAIIFDLPSRDEATLKEYILDDLIQQGVKTRFSPNATYTIDVLKIVKEHKIVDSALVASTENIRDAFNHVTSDKQFLTANDAESLVKNIDLIILLQIILDEMLKSGRLEPQDREKIIVLSYETSSKLKFLKANFQGIPDLPQ